VPFFNLLGINCNLPFITVLYDTGAGPYKHFFIAGTTFIIANKKCWMATLRPKQDKGVSLEVCCFLQ
jgi:hypothetical protein